ncbi:TadE/TadG family type IV pilus assembly protein [Verminephrobacter aporrectodeae]|uniref:TadE/TadG family type IV pilus assembly protein n=1 Tax=Verminephrobacter aporrectodeae TaxID=1110389 RepID=UPI0022443293|nr:TadE family protein [Verminephrobacter aporrectodeae]
MRQHSTPRSAAPRQRGSAMIEFTVVGPIITLLGLAMLQYGLVFFSKNQINHASFMAARAGSMAHAKLPDIRESYLRALVPLYGGGRDSAELAQAKAKAAADLQGNLRIDLLNPTHASFDDWNDPWLEQKYNARAIPNTGLADRNRNVGSQSGQSVQDANLLKIKVTHGYELKIPLVSTIYKHYLKWFDNGGDSFHSQLIAQGRLPVVTYVTLHMQSDAVEGESTISNPGAGNTGSPVNPGGSDGPGGGPGGPSGPGGKSPAPPDCITMGCTVLDSGNGSGTGAGTGDGGGAGGGGNGNGGSGGAPECF